ncbi:MAG: CBS domain-containing protein [Candidatus Schekmanbacteria bacterium]|nr:MAG: CBS domain-containing protein [Candidatus Schekmanbacteria bacterium]
MIWTKNKKMRTGIKVGDIMTRNFVFVSPDTNLKECSKKMVKSKVGCLIVKDGQKLKGVLTRREILWAIIKKSKKDLESILAKDVMKKKVVTIKPSADIIEAMNKFKKKKVRRLPVVEFGKVIGVITLKDILKMDPGLFEMIYEMIQIKEETEKMRKMDTVVVRRNGICDECGDYALLLKEDEMWICDSCYHER